MQRLVKALASVLVMCMFSTTALAVNVSPEDIAAAIPDGLSHPYLFFTEDEKDEIIERIENDPATSELYSGFLERGNNLLDQVVEPVPPQDKDVGNQLYARQQSPWEHAIRTYRTNAYILAFLYQMTGEDKYAQKAHEYAKEVCDTPTWVFRFCQYPYAYHRVSPWGAPKDKVVFTFAIIASDTASLMAITYDWIYPALTDKQRDDIRRGLLENAITQVRGNYEYHWWSEVYKCNWCAWCNTGLGLAALTLLTEDPQLVDVVSESYNRIYRTLSHIGPQGGWAEGTSYWAQTLRMSILFADALRRTSNGEYDLYRHPRLQNDPVNLAIYTSVPPHGMAIGIADAKMHLLGDPRFYNKIALETGDPVAAWIRENRFEEGEDLFDIIWPPNEVEPSLPEQASIHFTYPDWMVMRSDFTDPEKVMVVSKAGRNDDPHHGHLDVGQFMLYYRGVPFIRDLGAAAYDEKYFYQDKYDTPHAHSRGHNLVFVNGEQQIQGKLFKGDLDESIGGEVIEFRDAGNRVYSCVDASDAYPGEELETWRRHVVLDKPLVTIVLDEVAATSSEAEVTARFHSKAKLDDSIDGFLMIRDDVGDMAVVPVINDDYDIVLDTHPYLPYFADADSEYIPFADTKFTPEGNNSVFAHVLVPVEDDAEAKAIAESAQLSGDGTSLAFVYREEKYEFTFEYADDGGLRLE